MMDSRNLASGSKPRIHPAPHGRGSHYHPLRGAFEAAISQMYRGDWPAKLWRLWPRSTHVQLVHHELAWLPAGSAPLRIGFVSDLHLGPTTPPALLDEAFAKLAAEAPDVLLLGGDYVFLEATQEKALALAGWVSRVPATRKLAVLGNHDLWTHHLLLEEALRDVGVEWLHNASVRLGGLAIVGIDEPWTGTIDTRRALRDVGDVSTVIVLCHSPDGLPYTLESLAELPSVNRGLYVCGHTHGGHIATPWGPVYVPGRVGKRYPHGLHHVPPLHLHVSRGVGATELPMRAYAKPEVAIFDLVPSLSD
jgi:predicted MPP superfamily phosphohydrolase